MDPTQAATFTKTAISAREPPPTLQMSPQSRTPPPRSTAGTDGFPSAHTDIVPNNPKARDIVEHVSDGVDDELVLSCFRWYDHINSSSEQNIMLRANEDDNEGKILSTSSVGGKWELSLYIVGPVNRIMDAL